MQTKCIKRRLERQEVAEEFEIEEIGEASKEGSRKMG
jgi:hypothetical protein